MGAKTLLTVEQFERLPEIDGISYELDQGELVEVPSAAIEHNDIRDELLTLVRMHLKSHKDQGKALGEQSFRLNMDTVLIPDVALIGPAQISRIVPGAKIQPFGPLLAGEIVSPSNTVDELIHKTQQYLEAGARTVWILVPRSREIHVYSATAHPQILCADELLEEPALLPGFSVRVADLFNV